MQSTWNRSPSDASFCPTTVATRPPMPASTSSKCLQRQHHARQLAAGDDLRQRPWLLANVGRQEEFAGVDAGLAPLPFRFSAEQAQFEGGLFHRQVGELGFDGPAKRLGGLVTTHRELPCLREEHPAGLDELLFDVGDR